jgi:hypothetical protein
MIAPAPIPSQIPRLKAGQADTLLSASRGNQLIDTLNALAAMEGRGGIRVVKSAGKFVITTSQEAFLEDPFIGTITRQISGAIVQEGPDAIRIEDAEGIQHVVAKPFILQQFRQGAFAGTVYHLEENQIPTNYNDDSVYLYTEPITGTSEYRRTVILEGTQYDSIAPHELVEVIEPRYTPCDPMTLVPVTPMSQMIVAVRVKDVLRVDSTTLAYDPAAPFVQFIDMNIDARRWVKRREATYDEAVVPGIDDPAFLFVR